MNLSERISRIEVSPTMAVAARAAELKKQGIEIIDLVVGEPDFPTPPNIKSAANKALEVNFTKYTVNNGILELRSAIKNKFLQEYGIDYSADEILVSNGAKQCVYNAVQSIVSDDDEVIIPAPYYVSYTHMVKLAGGHPVIVKTNENNGFKLTPEILEKTISKQTKLLILCNPCNPTGTVYNEDELRQLMKIAIKHNLFVISDEVYEKLVFDDLKFVSLAAVAPEHKNKTVIINGMSKTYAMTGWRIGYALSGKELISSMAKLQSHSTSGANSISQFASVEALTGSQQSVEEMRKEFESRRNYLHGELNNINGMSCFKSSGAFYLFPNISNLIGKSYCNTKLTNSAEFGLFLLNEAKVAIVPGSGFGGEGYLRFSYATSMGNLEKAVKNIKDSLTLLR